jgi:hypothetical protein
VVTRHLGKTRDQPCAVTHSIRMGRKFRHNEVKVKVKVRPRTGREGPEGEQRYSSNLSLTSALDGVVNATPRPLYPRERDPVPIV